ncbi:hypothetical protein ACU4GR_33775 (plasmid) [Methylobacterium oryzae CBMB20]
MSEEPHPKYEIVLACLMQRLHGYAEELGLPEATVRQIVECVIADMPDADDFDRMAEARNRMLNAAR